MGGRRTMDASAAARAEELDVERLRQAIRAVYGPVEAAEDTEAIAAAYASRPSDERVPESEEH